MGVRKDEEVVKLSSNACNAADACSYALFLIEEFDSLDVNQEPSDQDEIAARFGLQAEYWHVHLVMQQNECARMLVDCCEAFSYLLQDTEVLDVLRLATAEPAICGLGPPTLSYVECASELLANVVYVAYQSSPGKHNEPPYPKFFYLNDSLGWYRNAKSRQSFPTVTEMQCALETDPAKASIAELLKQAFDGANAGRMLSMQIAKECQRATGKVPTFAVPGCSCSRKDDVPSLERLHDTTRRAIELYRSGATHEQVAMQLGISTTNARQKASKYRDLIFNS